MSDSDASLLARVVKDDDRAAFELLVRRYQSPLRNFLRRLARDSIERADDLAQETFLKLYTSIETYQGTAKFSTWLYRIAYNTFLNDLRKNVPEAEFDEAHHSPTNDAVQSVGDQSDLDRALRQLTARQSAVFDLHYRKDLTHQEVATVLELPLGTVKSDLTRGREELNAILKDWEQR
jgi:RNA polymerase sigma-70 factor (ECF subfamily)